MRKLTLWVVLAAAAILVLPAMAARVGEKAPDFTATDSNGIGTLSRNTRASMWCSNGTTTAVPT